MPIEPDDYADIKDFIKDSKRDMAVLFDKTIKEVINRAHEDLAVHLACSAPLKKGKMPLMEDPLEVAVMRVSGYEFWSTLLMTASFTDIVEKYIESTEDFAKEAGRDDAAVKQELAKLTKIGETLKGLAAKVETSLAAFHK